MAEIVTFSPAASIFGWGSLSKVPSVLESKGFRRVVIVTDPVVGKGEIGGRVSDLLKGCADVQLFQDVPTEPHDLQIEEVAGAWSWEADALLAVGGGSPMDFAKAISIILTHGGTMGDYLGEGSVPGPVLPVVCVPTTSGTGSQNTQTTVFTIEGVKRGVSSEFIRPVASVVDPELTVNLPPEVTQNAGYDALMHACESFLTLPCSQVADRPILYQGSNPFSRALSLEAFRSIWASYRRAVSDGRDREARVGMSVGSHLAGLAFSHSGLGVVHALASALGGMVDAPHGVCLAACTEIGLRYNLEACKETFSVLARVMGEVDGGTAPFLDRMLLLIGELGFPKRPSELGIGKEDAKKLYENVLIQTRRIKTNPRPLDDELLVYIERGI